MYKCNLFLLFILASMISCAYTSRDVKEASLNMQLNEKKIISVASQKAEELGYNIDDMNLSIENNGESWVVYFSPKSKKSYVVTGGDIEIFLDSNSTIIEIRRGQ